MHICRHASHAARKNLSTFGHEPFQQIRIFVVDCFERDIDSTSRHWPVGATKGRTTFGRFRLHGCYFVSRCTVWRRKNGLYFFFSSRFDVRGLFLFRVVMYCETGLPRAFASVHSRMAISCGIAITPSLQLERLPLLRFPRLLPQSVRTKR